MKKKSLLSLELDQQEEIKFDSIESKVFLEKNGNIYIGKELITEQMRGILRDQAKNFQTTNLYEILNATIINESFDIGVTQSSNFEHTQYAKALIYWNKVMLKIINALAK